MPKRSINAAAKGAVRPKRIRLTDTAEEMVASDQPNSSCSGWIRTLGVARNPAAPTRATKAMTATDQAGCSLTDLLTGPVSARAPGRTSGRGALARGARVMSICTGAFVLAKAGLLDGRPATTHWLHADRFRALFPDVRLDPDVLFIDDGDVLTSAGVGAGIDLCLHVVRRDHG